MNKHLSFSKLLFLIALLAGTGYLYFLLGYHTLRSDFSQLALIFSALFGLYLIAVKYFAEKFFLHLFFSGIVFRLIFLVSIPNLSDDVYRFIWDGRVAANGINPFAFLPSEIINMPSLYGISESLFQKLNSPEYYSIYPPVLQGIFWLTAQFFGENIFASMVFMKVIIMLVEIGTCVLLIRILNKLSMPRESALLYVLNPLIIVELTGNIHFDGLMIFCLLMALFLILSNYWKSSAILLGVGIATKLIPILFIPLMMYKLGWKKGSTYALITGVISLALFGLIFDASTIQHMINSIGLFIKTFEFNASFYYLFRWMGFMYTGYNAIALIGPLLLIVAACIILFVSWYGKERSNTSIVNKALLIVTVWFLFSTTVHPWYICLPVALSVLTKFRFAIVWSFTSIFSYAAYQFSPVKENIGLIIAGYLVVLVFGLWEVKRDAVQKSIAF